MNQLWFHLKFISLRFNSSLTFIFTMIVLTVTDHHDRKLPKSSLCHFFDKVEPKSDFVYCNTTLNAIRKMQNFLYRKQTGNQKF